MVGCSSGPSGFGSIGRRQAVRYRDAACMIAALVGIGALVGWGADIELLKRVRPDQVAMNPLSAVTFVIAAFALWSDRGESRRTLRRAGMAGAGLVALIGVVKLLEYIAGTGPHLDQILFASSLREAEAGGVNAMAPNTAFCFLLTGISLLLRNRAGAAPRHLRGAGALLVAALSLSALLGYLYGAKPLYGIAALIPMAMHTALTFFCLSTALIVSDTSYGLAAVFRSRRSGGFIARRLLPASTLAIIGLGWFRLQGQQLGLYSSETGVALMTTMAVFMLVAMVWYSALALDRLDQSREATSLELSHAHEALVQKTELLTKILECVGDGIVVRSEDGRVLLENPAAERLRSQGLELTPGTDAAQATDASDPSVGRWRLPDVRQMADGRWLQIATHHLSGFGQSQDVTMAVCRDVTDQTIREAQLTGKNDLLEAIIASRTADLRRSNEELQQFAYVASHDLQEPLRMVGSYLQLIERRYKGKLDEQADEFISFAVDGANRMKQLINDLLQFSRVESKGVEPVEMDCEEALAKALNDLKPAIAECGAEITFDRLPVLRADPAQMRQLFTNLIGNAIKFRGEDTPVVRVSATETADGWRFAIADNGIGIDPRYNEQIFEIFHRLHSREAYPGTGIGLAICKKIIDRHGGRIWVTSEARKGSTFHFTIPTPRGAADVRKHAA